MIKLFCTRQLPEEVIRDASRNGIEITARSFLRIIPVPEDAIKKNIMAELQQPHLRLLFTSKNAAAIAIAAFVRNIPESIVRSWRLYSLSGATKETLLTCFDSRQISATGKDAEELKQKMEKEGPPVHFFCGDRRRNVLPGFMKENNIRYKEWIIYKSVYFPAVIEDIYQGYLFYSPGAAESFFSVNSIHKSRSCFAIGKTTAAAIKASVDNPVYPAVRPDHAQLLQTIYNYFETRCRN